MALWAKWTLAGAEDAIEAFGRRLRDARRRASLSQMLLEQRSGVDQSLISRLERAKAPHASLERVVRLSQALGDDFPLGRCPHAHACVYRADWKPPPAIVLPYHTVDVRSATSQVAPDVELSGQPHTDSSDLEEPELEEDEADVGPDHRLVWTPEGISLVRS